MPFGTFRVNTQQTDFVFADTLRTSIFNSPATKIGMIFVNAVDNIKHI